MSELEKTLDEIAGAIFEVHDNFDCSSYHPREILAMALVLTAAS